MRLCLMARRGGASASLPSLYRSMAGGHLSAMPPCVRPCRATALCAARQPGTTRVPAAVSGGLDPLCECRHALKAGRSISSGL
jgi:hypothetical protein